MNDKPQKEEKPEVVGKTVMIVSDGGKVNIRQGNSTGYARISSVAPGTRLAYVATAENGWHAVAIGAKVGWVSGQYSKIV